MAETVEITPGQPTYLARVFDAPGQPTYEELKAQLEALQAQQAKQTRAPGTIEFRVSEKGAISAYGLQRFPVTLYYEQWEKVYNAKDIFDAFVETIIDNPVVSWTKPKKEKAEPYTEEQKAADWALMHGKTSGSPEQVAFATQRFNAYNEKRFGSK